MLLIAKKNLPLAQLDTWLPGVDFVFHKIMFGLKGQYFSKIINRFK